MISSSKTPPGENSPAHARGKFRAIMLAAVVLTVIAALMTTVLGGGAAYGVAPHPGAPVSTHTQEVDSDLVSTRVCGTPTVRFTNHKNHSQTRTDQKNVIVSTEFIGADIAEFFLNGTRILLGEGLGGRQQSYSVDVELLEGENTIRIVGTESCSTETGERGLFAEAETSIIFDPTIINPPGPGIVEQPGKGLLPVTGIGIDLLFGALIGIVLSLLSLLFLSKLKRRQT